MYNNYDYSRFYSPSCCWTPMSGIPPTNEIPPFGSCPTYNTCPPGYRSVPVEVKPINVNLTVNSSKSFTVFQKEQVFNTSTKQIIVPEVNIKVTVEKDNKPPNNGRYRGRNRRRHPRRFNNRYNGRYPPPRPFSRFSPHKRFPPGSTSVGSTQTDFLKGAKMIEIDMKSLNGKNPLEEVIHKILGISKKDQNENKMEAPLSKEMNFDLDKEYNELPFEVKNLNDLIALADLYDKSNEHMFGFNMKRLNIIKDSLVKLNEVIGMQEVKNTITNKLITYLQGLGDMDDMNHIVIQAPPGYGKTMLGFHLSEIFYKLGLIKVPVKKSDESPELTEDYIHPFTGEKIDFPFIVAKRKDMIGEYVGQTAPKVEKMVNKALGGVLFIDEAYSLGSKGKVSYSEECINTLNQLLSEKAGQFICIIAGYKENLKESFFINPGLQRRFRMVFEINKYNEKELALIFEKMVNDKKWSLDKKILENDMNKLINFMKTNQEQFKYCGGDMETLLQNVRDAHSMRVFGSHPKNKKIITMEDLKEGLEMFKQSNDRDDSYNYIMKSLYI